MYYICAIMALQFKSIQGGITMDELDFTILASGNFGNFMWEYPDNIKKLLQKLRELGGEEVVNGIIEEQKNNILVLLHLQVGILQAGPLALTMMQNVRRQLGEMATESLKLLQSH